MGDFYKELEEAVSAVFQKHFSRKAIISKTKIDWGSNTPDFEIAGQALVANQNSAGNNQSTKFKIGDTVIFTSRIDSVTSGRGIVEDVPGGLNLFYVVFCRGVGRIYAAEHELVKDYYQTTDHAPSVSENTHAGHGVIENTAGGKTFKYCRKCKCEV